MNAEQLRRFIKDNYIEYHLRGDNNNDVWIWVNPGALREFCEDLLGYGYFDDGGVEVVLTHGGHAIFEMNEVCEYFGIELKDAFDFPELLE